MSKMDTRNKEWNIKVVFITFYKFSVTVCMFSLHTAKLESIIAHKKYCARVTAQYDKYRVIIDTPAQESLTPEVFARYGIFTLKDLGKYLDKHAEYGGYAHVPWKDETVLIPFHHDFFNSWLRFDNPRVTAFYDELYEHIKQDYENRIHFNMARFHVEETLQLNYWEMPPLDERMLSAPINGCWDKPELLGCFLGFQGFETKRLCCHEGNIMRGHCFTVFHDGTYWRTTMSSWLNLKCKDYDVFCKKIYQVLKRLPIFKDASRCELVEYAPPTAGMNTKEFLQNIGNGKVLVRK